jgi:hypothetical protein
METDDQDIAHQGRRVGLGSVIVGTLVALGIAALLGAVGLAIVVSTVGLEDRDPLIAMAAAIAAIAAFAAGRFAAIDSRSLTRRDGALVGFVTWAMLSGIIGVTSVAIGTWAWAKGWFDAAAAATRADAPTLLWGAVLMLVLLLGAAILGGVRGARSEAKAIGLLAVYSPDRVDDVEDVDAFERRYLADT